MITFDIRLNNRSYSCQHESRGTSPEVALQNWLTHWKRQGLGVPSGELSAVRYTPSRLDNYGTRRGG